MKNLFYLIIYSLFLLNTCIHSYAQESSYIINSTYWNELYKSVENKYGFDQVLVNGACYEDKYQGKANHPFLSDNQLQKGTLVFRQREYPGVFIKYDIYKQQVILYIRYNNSIAWVIPPNDFISSFNLGDKSFVKYNYEGKPRFYQVVFDSEELKCLYYWSKLRDDHETDNNTSGFSDAKRKNYLIMNHALYRYTNNRSFVGLFPQRSQILIKRYLKENKIKTAKGDDTEIRNMLSYCKAFIQNP
jgi:hypothetical protein